MQWHMQLILFAFMSDYGVLWWERVEEPNRLSLQGKVIQYERTFCC
jgi:hypothetical protein